jgi:hypothetical protein
LAGRKKGGSSMILKFMDKSDVEVFDGVVWYRGIHNNGSQGITGVEFKCVGGKKKIKKIGFKAAYVMNNQGTTIDKFKD